MATYQLDVIKSTQLAKKLGGPPTFHDGFLKRVTLSREQAVLEVKILSDNNPRLDKDTTVALYLHGVKRFTLTSEEEKDSLFILHDLDVRRTDEGLHLRMESSGGDVSDVVFEHIELRELK